MLTTAGQQNKTFTSASTAAGTNNTSNGNRVNPIAVKGLTKDDNDDEKSPKKKQTFLYLCTTKCRYVVVRKALKQLGYKMMDDENGDWDIYWSDVTGTTPEQLAKLQPHQRINHYPGMYQLARKNNLSRNLMRMAKVFPNDYNFFPKTWVLP